MQCHRLQFANWRLLVQQELEGVYWHIHTLTQWDNELHETCSVFAIQLCASALIHGRIPITSKWIRDSKWLLSITFLLTWLVSQRYNYFFNRNISSSIPYATNSRNNKKICTEILSHAYNHSSLFCICISQIKKKGRFHCRQSNRIVETQWKGKFNNSIGVYTAFERRFIVRLCVASKKKKNKETTSFAPAMCTFYMYIHRYMRPNTIAYIAI